MNPPFRQRFLIALALMTVSGGLIWWGTYTVTRLCGLAALAASALYLALSVRDLRRHRRHSKTYIRHFAVAYAAHFVVAILLASLLRAWVIFAPPAPSPLLAAGGPPLQERLDADTARLLALAAAEADDPETCHRLAQTYQTFFQIDAVAHPKAHADAFLLSFAALLHEARLHALPAATAAEIDRRAAVRLAASAAYLPLVRDHSPGNPLLPLIDRELRGFPERRPFRFPLHTLRRYALSEENAP